jgi:hypothetical protein
MKKMEVEKELIIKIEKLKSYKLKHKELRVKLDSIKEKFDDSKLIYENEL